MATQTPNKVSKEERKLLLQGLQMLHTSAERSAKSAKSDTIRDAYEAEAGKLGTLINRLTSGELEL